MIRALFRVQALPRCHGVVTIPADRGKAARSMRRTAFTLLIATLLGLGGSAFAQQDEAVPAFKEVDSLEARVQGCVTCHGQNGQGTVNGYFPRIAGKPAGYLYKQLSAFRDRA